MSDPATAIWPRPEVVHGMLRGWRGVFRTCTGLAVSGLRSIHPWVYYVDPAGAACERCATLEPPPDPPKGTHGPLFGPQTREYALFMLAWLHAFAGRHSICEPRREATA